MTLNSKANFVGTGIVKPRHRVRSWFYDGKYKCGCGQIFDRLNQIITHQNKAECSYRH